MENFTDAKPFFEAGYFLEMVDYFCNQHFSGMSFLWPKIQIIWSA
jgi:hypothetical protein